MEGLVAPVDDIPLQVVKPVEEIINSYSVFDSQISPDLSNAVVAAHQAAKTPSKRTSTKSKVFKSPYTTEYAFGSKALEDETTGLKQNFAFEGFTISNDIPRGIIEEYKK
ncbi:hypothetical protein FXO38_21132 [Capsicum annuum]|nr:hypothetical protein FXO38_21132 [Capsicum annuum]KAF3662154.1 hypothetical protein FXO37_12579 [Capsicum annuum]